MQEIADDAGCSYHTIRKWLKAHDLSFAPHERSHTAWNKGKSGYPTALKHSSEHLAAIRAARTGSASNFWRGGVSSDRRQHRRLDDGAGAERCTGSTTTHASHVSFEAEQLHAHHIAPVWLEPSRSRDIGNLISLCEQCHRAVHNTRDAELAFMRRHSDRIGSIDDIDVPSRKGFKLTAHAVRVVALQYVGLRQTYDLSIEGPWHNFVANGLVVHNSFNEFSMRYAKATDDFYVPEADDVRSQVGKPGAYSFEPVSAELAEETAQELEALYKEAYATYAASSRRASPASWPAP